MRISISGEKSLIKALSSEMEQDEESSVERVGEAKDQTEQHFGIGEVLTVIGIVKGVSDLVKMLLSIKSSLGPTKQKLQFKTALGTTVVELDKNITAEELHRELGTILPQL